MARTPLGLRPTSPSLWEELSHYESIIYTLDKHSSYPRRTSQSSRVSEQGMSALPVPDSETHRNIVARNAEVVRKS